MNGFAPATDITVVMNVSEQTTTAVVGSPVDVKAYEWMLRQHGGLDAVLLDMEAERLWAERWTEFTALPDGTILESTLALIPEYTVERGAGSWRSPLGGFENQVHFRNRFQAGALQIRVASR